MLTTVLWLLIKALILVFVLIGAAAVELIMERKFIGYFQLRVGPNRVGPWGLFQPIADVVKMLFKEDIVPQNADKLVFKLAPMIAFFCALAAYAVIPWGPGPGWTMVNSNAGILVFLAVGSLSVYGVALGGWASQSKYSLLGSMRSTAQMISYELALGMSVIGLILLAGSTKIADIVAAQGHGAYGYNWLWQLPGFIVFMISALAETARTPFDLPESETELVGGYNTEYAGMRFGLFFLGEIVHLLNMSSLVALLYLGGWNTIPFLSFIPGGLAYALKICFMIFVFIWIRVTWPRMRYDRLMSFGWKVMLPLAALNLLGTAIYVALS
ncbi:MAG TPA: NADH-quinone oxidoreductase subunit NuoH [Symbiobacteriaceae bacterium]|jgi:NADH-quinone oxidoreductase subunit H|nr:NADH-quinone oxidoreductase subunit NuoH [Symbiobacteriaceae bacterium]